MEYHVQQRTITLILDNLRSVFNTASLFRTADCFGVVEILLCGTTPTPVDRFGRVRSDFAKVSLGAELSVVWRYYSDTSLAVEDVRRKGVRIISLEQSESSVPIHTQLMPDNCALIVGNEVAGVGSDILALSDAVWEIQQLGQKESLNVCIAGSIALYHLRFVAGTVS